MFAGNPVFLQSFKRGISSVGRAIGSQSIGQGFESPILHFTYPHPKPLPLGMDLALFPPAFCIFYFTFKLFGKFLDTVVAFHFQRVHTSYAVV